LPRRARRIRVGVATAGKNREPTLARHAVNVTQGANG
jgi:hypothetical protein